MSFHVSPVNSRFGAIRIEGFAPQKKNLCPQSTLPVDNSNDFINDLRASGPYLSLMLLVRQIQPGNAASPVILTQRSAISGVQPSGLEDLFTQSCEKAGLTVTKLSEQEHAAELKSF
jgi:hypothetical protein